VADATTPDLGARLQAALGRAYRVECGLGGGGMSRVLVAEETRLGRHVVVKVLPPELRAGLSTERFHRETRLAAALGHPHIVPLLVAGESDDGLVYFTSVCGLGADDSRAARRCGARRSRRISPYRCFAWIRCAIRYARTLASWS
jgi:serine/threonine protein kinase